MQKSFCKAAVLAGLVLVPHVQAENEYLRSFRRAGDEVYSVHGLFRDAVVKTFFHDFVEEQLPNAALFSIGEQEFNLHDVFKALSDALADILDGHIMADPVDYSETVRHACVGHVAHKLWIALLHVIGVNNYVSDEVKDHYKKFGKAWFSKAFALSFDHALKSLK